MWTIFPEAVGLKKKVVGGKKSLLNQLKLYFVHKAMASTGKYLIYFTHKNCTSHSKNGFLKKNSNYLKKESNIQKPLKPNPADLCGVSWKCVNN